MDRSANQRGVWLVRWALPVAAVLFGVFVANIIIGRILVSGGTTGGTGLPDVVEFLIFLAAVVFFVIAIVDRERSSAARGEPVSDIPLAASAEGATHGRHE
ncbi:MAG: hypothetical protein R3349_04715 [Geminicoccaceae bacterium]|nr:hypothetical protein [Geminicoccaceae bacterium]